MQLKSLLVSGAALLLATLNVRADSVWVNSGASTLEFAHVQIQGVRDGKLVYIPTSGREASRDLAQVARLLLDDDPALNAAEDAYSKAQWDVATDAYRKSMMATSKSWTKDWCAQRLLVAAQKANRFDAAASAYIAVALSDPGAAKNLKPALPGAQSTYIASALAEVTTALAGAKLSAAQQQALLAFQLDLQNAGKDSKGAASTMEKMLQTGAVATADPAASAALVKLKLDQASSAFEAKDYAKVVNDLKSSAAIFIDPKDQARALYLIADAQFAIAQTKNDPASLQDAGLAYMRVVAHFSDVPANAPLVARSLYNAAQIEEKLNDPATAISLYKEVVTKYPNDATAPPAAASLQRLQPRS